MVIEDQFAVVRATPRTQFFENGYKFFSFSNKDQVGS